MLTGREQGCRLTHPDFPLTSGFLASLGVAVPGPGFRMAAGGRDWVAGLPASRRGPQIGSRRLPFLPGLAAGGFCLLSPGLAPSVDHTCLALIGFWTLTLALQRSLRALRDRPVTLALPAPVPVTCAGGCAFAAPGASGACGPDHSPRFPNWLFWLPGLTLGSGWGPHLLSPVHLCGHNLKTSWI